MWCRFVDSYSKDYRNDLLNIEMSVFMNIKKEVIEETGPWTGSQKQNVMADVKIAFSIYSSFRSYEKSLKRHGSYFNFRRI